MDKDEVKRVLAPYCPPLSLSQVEAIAEKIAVMTSIPEPEAPAKPVHSSKSSHKS